MTTGRHQSGRLAGIGMLAFGVMALLATLWWLKPGAHPLAGVSEYALCDDVAAAWAGHFDAASFRAPGVAGLIECRVTLRGDGSSTALPGAEMLVGLQTTATLRRAGGLRADTRALIETFVAESRASGQQVVMVEGPWRGGWLLSGGTGASILIAEDRGVVLTVIAPGVEARRLAAPATALAERLR